ncbi:receptor-like protein kinase ANXUR2, partial [Trifolium medium]|nr:receptor-like protein kinase ANXUR2 [Trifolium medium]
GVPLSVRFRRLFDLSVNKTSSVAEMCELGWEEGGAAWQWRRQLWVWEEEMLGECRGLLIDIVMQPNISDQWLWRHDIGGGYSVRGAYNLLTTMASHGVDASSDLIWHKHVPLKVLSWLGGFYVTGSRLKTIWSRVISFLMTLSYACLVAAVWNQLIICFFPALLSPPCGVWLNLLLS